MPPSRAICCEIYNICCRSTDFPFSQMTEYEYWGRYLLIHLLIYNIVHVQLLIHEHNNMCRECLIHLGVNAYCTHSVHSHSRKTDFQENRAFLYSCALVWFHELCLELCIEYAKSIFSLYFLPSLVPWQSPPSSQLSHNHTRAINL